MKSKIIILIILISSICVGMAEIPQWVKKLPSAGNNTYRYVMESASGATVDEARKKAFLQVFYSTANRLGILFSLDDINNAVHSEADFVGVSEEYEVPINKVCEYRKKINGGVEVYLLCQVAIYGNIEPVFDEFRDCESYLSDEIAVEVKFPAEWNVYKTSAYISSFQRGKNDRGVSEISFRNSLADVAKREVMSRLGISGEENSLIVVMSSYNSNTRDGFAVAYAEKNAICNHYKRTIDVLFNKIEGGITKADVFFASGKNEQAAQELRSLQPVFSDIDKQISKLTTYGCPAFNDSYTSKRNQLEQTIQTNLNEIETAVVSIYVDVEADLFGSKYTQLKNAINQQLSTQEYILADSPDEANYEIRITAETNKHPAQNPDTYFAYVEATLTIKNRKTRKVVYSGSVSEKGGSTLNYENAARTAYKKIDKQLANTISTQLKK